MSAPFRLPAAAIAWRSTARDGTLVASGEDSPQLGEVALHGAKGGNTLAPMPVPQRFTVASPGTPTGEPANVGQMYTLFAQAIRDHATHNGESRQPNFASAVELHRLVDAIKQASDNGQETAFATRRG
jgi:predicted dehydrogenase